MQPGCGSCGQLSPGGGERCGACDAPLVSPWDRGVLRLVKGAATWAYVIVVAVLLLGGSLSCTYVQQNDGRCWMGVSLMGDDPDCGGP